MRRSRSFAFTLIELLTVMAISAILLGIIVAPIFQSFNLTRAAQAFADAQDKARLLSERIAREIGNASSVRDTSFLVPVVVNGKTQFLPASGMTFALPGPDAKTNPNWTPVEVTIPYTKIDLIKAAEGDPSNKINGAYVNPVTGKGDPTMSSSKGQVNLPLAPGSILVRYFIALRDPFSKYNAPYDGILMAQTGTRDNLYVLYRAEVPMRNADGSVNTGFFEVNNDGSVKFDDPRFMIPDGTQAKAARIQNWLSHSVVQTEVSRYDMIQPLYDKASRKVTYDGNIPRFIPLVQFRPTLVSDDPASGANALRAGEEAPGANRVAPDVFETRYGLWSNFVIRNYLPDYQVGQNYQTGRLTDVSDGFQIWDTVPPGNEPRRMLFKVGVYENGVANGSRFPFTDAALAANADDILMNIGPWLEQDYLRDLFTPYDFNSRQGRIVTSFSIEEVGDSSKAPLGRPNLPLVKTGDQVGVTSKGTGAVWGGDGYEINSAFNRAYNEFPDLQPSLQRFIDLRVTPNEDGTLPPLYPNHIANTVTGFPRAGIVPGSEVVYGPDQNRGENFGRLVRYVRVPANPGPNQYTINYVNLAEPPSYASLGIPASALSGFDPDIYDPNNFVSAVIQPRFKAGYIGLYSDPNNPLPDTVGFHVSYRFQFNSKQAQPAAGTAGTDTFTVDYDSRQLVGVLVTIRNYAQSNLPNAQTVTLKATATVRNLIR